MKLSTTRAYLEWAFRDCGAIELRHQHGGRWLTGWYDNEEALLKEARCRSRSGNLYISLNAPKPRLVCNAMTGTPLLDKEVGWITRLPFDFDPLRPREVGSTDHELQFSGERCDALVARLYKLGWPLPARAASGNGHHAVYRVRLPSNPEVNEMLSQVYLGLHHELDDDLVAFDRSVRNPGRIFRLYGSWNRKGPNTPERPHRQSTVRIPPQWRQVKPQQIEQLAEHYARQRAPAPRSARPLLPRPTGTGDYRTLDIVAWFAHHGLYRHHIEGLVHAVWCPWRAVHTTAHGRSGAVILETNGAWPNFHCHHAHCARRGIRDVMQLLGDADAFCSVQFGGGQPA
jgi:hypothetical protein